MGRRQQGEGSVYFREDRGQWVAVADLGPKGGKRDRREFTAATSAGAIDKRDRFFEKRARTGFTPPKGRAPYVSEWVLHWVHNIARTEVEPESWENYRTVCELHICPFFSRVVLDDVDEDDIRAWHAHLLATPTGRTGRPLSAVTIGHAHRILSMALHSALRTKPRRLGWNPAADVRPPKADPGEPMPPDEEEVLQLLETLEDWRTGARWATALGTGMRQSECLGLLWPHVDLADADNAGIDVQWQLTRRKWEHGCGDPAACGKPSACPGRHDGGLQLKRPKSASSRAWVPLPRFAALMVRDWRKAQKEERLALGPKWTGWEHGCGRRLRPKQYVCPDCMLPASADLLVFARPGGTPVDRKYDWEDWSALLEAAGLPHYNPHTGTRHQVATALLEEGQDIRVVQEIMRHASPDITRRLYQHVRPKMRAAAASALERRMGGRR